MGSQGSIKAGRQTRDGVIPTQSRKRSGEQGRLRQRLCLTAIEGKYLGILWLFNRQLRVCFSLFAALSFIFGTKGKLFFFNVYLFGCAACQLWHMGSAVFLAACSIFSWGLQTLSYSMWDLGPWPGIEPGPSELGVWNLSHWTTRQVPKGKFNLLFAQIPLSLSTALWGSSGLPCSSINNWVKSTSA